jgi:hypothetical protein
LNLCHLNFDIPSMEFTLDVSSHAFLSGDIRISSLCWICSTTVENSLQITPFYAKQTQSQVRQNQHKIFINNEIRVNGQLVIQTKQTQFKANKAKNKPNSNPIKANSNPIQSQFNERAKFNAFAWIWSLTIVLIMLLADFTTLKGAQFHRLFLTNRLKFDRMGSNSKWLNPR